MRDIIGFTREDYVAALQASHDNSGYPGSFDARFAVDRLSDGHSVGRPDP